MLLAPTIAKLPRAGGGTSIRAQGSLESNFTLSTLPRHAPGKELPHKQFSVTLPLQIVAEQLIIKTLRTHWLVQPPGSRGTE